MFFHLVIGGEAGIVYEVTYLEARLVELREAGMWCESSLWLGPWGVLRKAASSFMTVKSGSFGVISLLLPPPYFIL